MPIPFCSDSASRLQQQRALELEQRSIWQHFVDGCQGCLSQIIIFRSIDKEYFARPRNFWNEQSERDGV